MGTQILPTLIGLNIHAVSFSQTHEHRQIKIETNKRSLRYDKLVLFYNLLCHSFCLPEVTLSDHGYYMMLPPMPWMVLLVEYKRQSKPTRFSLGYFGIDSNIAITFYLMGSI